MKVTQDPKENTSGQTDRFFHGQVISATPGRKAGVYNKLDSLWQNESDACPKEFRCLSWCYKSPFVSATPGHTRKALKYVMGNDRGFVHLYESETNSDTFEHTHIFNAGKCEVTNGQWQHRKLD